MFSQTQDHQQTSIKDKNLEDFVIVICQPDGLVEAIRQVVMGCTSIASRSWSRATLASEDQRIQASSFIIVCSKVERNALRLT